MYGGGPSRPPGMARHAGIGSQGGVPGASPSNGSGAPQFTPAAFPSVAPSASWDGEKFSMFVGNIADGVIDGWLERVLGTVGTVLAVKRPTPAFAFVEYGDPESVLRCLQVLDGAILIGKSGQEKALTVKVDQKNRERLDKYEETREQNETQKELVEQAKEELEQIVNLMRRGDLPAIASVTVNSGLSQPSKQMPLLRNHLADLPPEEIPEQHRGIITSEIAQFRERAAQRAREKQRSIDAQQALRKQEAASQSSSQRQWGATPPTARQPAPLTANDPQSFSRPVGFVPSSATPQRASSGYAGASPVATGSSTPGPSSETVASHATPPAAPLIDDLTCERERQERARREAEHAFRERERRFESREKHRIQAVERERARERSAKDSQERERLNMSDKLAHWDDDREAEKGRELFYTDRERWRSQRRARRMREIEADARDREIEAQRRAAAQRESEARKADEYAKMSDAKRREIARTLPANAETKVSLNVAPAKTGTAKPAPQAAKKAVLGGAEDEEDEKKKRRELIPLTYSDDEDADAEDLKKRRRAAYRMTTAEKQRKTRDIRDSLPRDKESLFEMRVKWSLLSEDLLKDRIKPVVTKLIAEYLGAPDDDLLTAVLEHLRARKAASALVQELEPVLDEEANDMVRKVWFEMLFEIALVHTGID